MKANLTEIHSLQLECIMCANNFYAFVIDGSILKSTGLFLWLYVQYSIL